MVSFCPHPCAFSASSLMTHQCAFCYIPSINYLSLHTFYSNRYNYEPLMNDSDNHIHSCLLRRSLYHQYYAQCTFMSMKIVNPKQYLNANGRLPQLQNNIHDRKWETMPDRRQGPLQQRLHHSHALARIVEPPKQPALFQVSHYHVRCYRDGQHQFWCNNC